MGLIDELPGGIRIAMGRNPLVRYNSLYGYNPDVDATTEDVDIWNGDGLYTGFPDQVETLTVVSSSASDTAAGTGARQVRLYGRDGNGISQTELVTLNGTSPAETTKTWSRMSFARVTSAGSGSTNLGTLTVAHSSTTTNVFAVMPAGVSRTNIAAYTVPGDRRAAFMAYRGSLSNNGGAGTAARVRVSVMTREPGSGVWEQRRSIWVSNVNGVSEVRLDGAVMLPPGTDVVMRCLSGASTGNLAVAGSFAVFTVPLD